MSCYWNLQDDKKKEVIVLTGMLLLSCIDVLRIGFVVFSLYIHSVLNIKVGALIRTNAGNSK